MLGICIGISVLLLVAEEEVPIAIVIMLLVVTSLFLWILFGTSYRVDREWLIWKTGPFFGKIRIKSIRKIQYDNGFIKYQTLKPGLHYKGLVVHFNKFDDIFISPDNREEFIDALCKTNPAIVVEKKPI